MMETNGKISTGDSNFRMWYIRLIDASVRMGLQFLTCLMNEMHMYRNTHTRTTIAQYNNVLFKYAVTWEALQ